MAKRFTDTDKWKKQFIRGLEGAYKLLWLYILDDCDMAGIWPVDMEVARIRIGEPVEIPAALRLFGDRIEQLDGGKKWFIRDFILFQYGELKETNRMHLAVINTLKKNNINPQQGASEPLPRGQGQGQGIIQGQGKGQIQGAPKIFEETWRSAFDEMTMESYITQFAGLDVKNEQQVFLLKCNAHPEDYHKRDHAGLRMAFLHQLKNSKGSGPRKKAFEL